MNTVSKSNNAESAIDQLKRFKELGYLFHGSSNDGIHILEPRHTVDHKTKENTDTAVFATDDIGWSVVFGLYGGHTGWSTRFENDIVVAKIPSKDRHLVENMVGSVYVLPSDRFTSDSGGRQYRSWDTVTPVTSVRVRLEDFYKLGGKIIWY